MVNKTVQTFVFSHRNVLYGKNVNIYKTKGSRCEYFKYKRSYHLVKNYKKVKNVSPRQRSRSRDRVTGGNEFGRCFICFEDFLSETEGKLMCPNINKQCSGKVHEDCFALLENPDYKDIIQKACPYCRATPDGPQNLTEVLRQQHTNTVNPINPTPPRRDPYLSLMSDIKIIQKAREAARLKAERLSKFSNMGSSTGVTGVTGVTRVTPATRVTRTVAASRVPGTSGHVPSTYGPIPAASGRVPAASAAKSRTTRREAKSPPLSVFVDYVNRPGPGVFARRREEAEAARSNLRVSN
jgi:hypothetical protein